DSDHCGIDLTSIDDLIKRCSARLYLQRCCAADRGGMDLYSSVDLFVDIEFCSGADPSALMIFAAVCSGLQQIATAMIYLLTTYFAADCGDDDLFVDIEFYSGVDPSALMIFAVVLIYSSTSIFAAVCSSRPIHQQRDSQQYRSISVNDLTKR